MATRHPTWTPDRRRAVLARDVRPGVLHFDRSGDVVARLPAVWTIRARPLTRSERAAIRATDGRAPKVKKERINTTEDQWEVRPRDGGPVQIRKLRPTTPLWEVDQVPPDLVRGLLAGRDPRLDPLKGDRLHHADRHQTYGPILRVDHRRGLVDWGEGPRPIFEWRALWHCSTSCTARGSIQGSEEAAAPSAELLRPLDTSAALATAARAQQLRQERAAATRATRATAPKRRCKSPPGGAEAYEHEKGQADEDCAAMPPCTAGRFGAVGLGDQWLALQAAMVAQDRTRARAAWEALYTALEQLRPEKNGRSWNNVHPAFRSPICGDSPLEGWEYLEQRLREIEPPRVSPPVALAQHSPPYPMRRARKDLSDIPF
ncbi:hypothetical protein L6R50_14850 [Myxococcota bacterium]|nr:hypothetical protein [Myxococcota bacterium]